MKYLVFLAVFTMLVPAGAEAGNDKQELACAAVKEKIRTIEAKMRSGYTRAQGERYEARLRELKTQRYKLCR